MGFKHRKKFNDHPFGYHEEIELEIATLTNLGVGLARVELPAAKAPPPSETTPRGGWVVMVPFTLPGERVRARVFRNHKNYSEADLINVLTPSPHRVAAPCPLFGRCGGCQYQHLTYTEQLAWKQRHVGELLQYMAGIADFPVAPVIPSPRDYGYRSKITPHFAAPRPDLATRSTTATEPGPGEAKSASACAHPADAAPAPIVGGQDPTTARPFPIGFLRQGTRFDLVDVPRCIIATDAINAKLIEVRADVRRRAAAGDFKRGATLLLREASGIVTTDYDAVITETIGGKTALASPTSDEQALRLHFLARDFFQNNPFILPAFTAYVREQAASSGARFLVDAYCGSGLFALSCARAFERVAGIEISETSIRFARENASANGIENATFQAGDAAQIFAGLIPLASQNPPAFASTETVVVIDPPRKGCDESFLQQLFAFGPRAVVYVSCDPATQMRDLRHFLAAGYSLKAAQPFDLFPQTRHLECVLTLQRTDPALAQT